MQSKREVLLQTKPEVSRALRLHEHVERAHLGAILRTGLDLAGAGQRKLRVAGITGTDRCIGRAKTQTDQRALGWIDDVFESEVGLTAESSGRS